MLNTQKEAYKENMITHRGKPCDDFPAFLGLV